MTGGQTTSEKTQVNAVRCERAPLAYGGQFAWVGVPYKMEVASGWSPLQWMNGLAKRLLLLDNIALAADGGFRCPGMPEPLFPKGSVDIRWRWDDAGHRIVIDFWNNGELLSWRWDELRPFEELRFPSEVPDLIGLGHVGQFSFRYSLLAAAAVPPPRGASRMDPAAHPSLQLPSLLASQPRGSYHFDVRPGQEACRDFARIFGMAEHEPKLFMMCPGLEIPKPLRSTSAFAGDLNAEVITDAMRECRQHVEAILAASSDGCAAQCLTNEVFERIAALASTATGLAFAEERGVLRCFLQPIYVILCMGNPLQIRILTYGYVAESAEEVMGERPSRKWTPFLARLLSPEVSQETDGDILYEVRMGQSGSTAECMALDAELLKEAVDSGQCSMLFSQLS